MYSKSENKIAFLMKGKKGEIGKNLLVGGAHAVSLARPRLSVGEDGDVVALEELRDDLLHRTLVELLVGAVRPEGEVVGEGLHWIRVVDEHLREHLLL